MECNFCKKIFSSKSSLNNHQKTTKYCLNIQNKGDVNNFSCQHCNKCFTVKKTFVTHLKTCKKLEAELKEKKSNEKEYINKIEQQLKELKEYNKELLEQLKEKDKENNLLKGQILIYKDDHEFIKEIAKQPKTNTNTNTITTNNLNINSILDFNNLDKIKCLIKDNLDIQYIIDGQKGLARWCHSNKKIFSRR